MAQTGAVRQNPQGSVLYVEAVELQATPPVAVLIKLMSRAAFVRPQLQLPALQRCL